MRTIVNCNAKPPLMLVHIVEYSVPIALKISVSGGDPLSLSLAVLISIKLFQVVEP